MATESIIDSLTSGVVTDEEMDGDPYCFRVTWIRWHSGFRGSGLRIGDRVLGLDGVRYDRAARKEYPKAFGQYSESQHWEEMGTRDGQTVTLTVKRGREVLEVKGRILAERRWRNAKERVTIGPDGPEEQANDGLGYDGWSSWLEKSIEGIGSRVLDGGWRRGPVSQSRMMLADHLEQKPRVDFLVKTYPGPFAAATLED